MSNYEIWKNNLVASIAVTLNFDEIKYDMLHERYAVVSWMLEITSALV
jgi:hypothetical protein